MKISRQYVAGFLDGEGTVTWKKTRNDHMSRGFRYTPHIMLSNTNLKLLKRIQQQYGGTITKVSRKKRKSNHKIGYKLEFTSRKALNFAKTIFPFTIDKHSQLELFIEAYERGAFSRNNWCHKPNGDFDKMPKSHWALQDYYFEKIRKLNE